MADENLGEGLQLSILAALTLDKTIGVELAAQLRADYFDGQWRPYASELFNYWRRYSKPPGKTIAADLAEAARLGGKEPELRDKLLGAVFDEGNALNADYILGRAQLFVRKQLLKVALNSAIERYSQADEAMVGDVEAILSKALRYQQETMDAGMLITDPRGLEFLDRNKAAVILLGIKELDALNVGMVPKQALLYLGPKGTGKSWFCVHCGAVATQQGKKVLHVSLEMQMEQVVPRYYQNLFGYAQSSAKYTRTKLELDDFGKAVNYNQRLVNPTRVLYTPGAKKVLKAKLNQYEARFGDLVVKCFPTTSLTIEHLIGYLDYLENVEKFVPDVLIIDYPKLMKLDKRDVRISMGTTFEELRGILVSRNMAGVFPHQSDRSTIGGRQVRSRNASEDISVVQTADTVLTFSRTMAEEELGLGRLTLEHARDVRGGVQLLLAQSYDTGQYVTGSGFVSNQYWERLKARGATDDEED